MSMANAQRPRPPYVISTTDLELVAIGFIYPVRTTVLIDGRYIWIMDGVER
jgi:hypothetical protein